MVLEKHPLLQGRDYKDDDFYPNFYADARHYDFVSGAFAAAYFLDFYRWQISRYGEPVPELAYGSGRLTIPLAEERVNITGLDISEQTLEIAKLKASERGVNLRLIQAAKRNFDLGEKFNFIYIPAQSLTPLYRREELENCFSCGRQHLAEDGRFLIGLFNSSVKMLAHDFPPPRIFDWVNRSNTDFKRELFCTPII